MRIAVVSDIHGNATAFAAVLADLRETSPDQVFHGGDLADMGASPVEIVDRIRDLGWPGVSGNGEEALANPETLERFARHSSAPSSLWDAVRQCMAATRELLGDDRLCWMRALPPIQAEGPLALVHASPETPWRAPDRGADDAELIGIYAPLERPVAVYGHIHRPFVRILPLTAGRPMLVANAGSVGLSYDGDPRAAYLLIDDEIPTIRRVEYDLAEEANRLTASGLPHAGWIVRALRAAAPQMP